MVVFFKSGSYYKLALLVLICCSFLLLGPCSKTYASAPTTPKNDKVWGAVKSDQALVYFIRPSISDFTRDWLYADEQFLTCVKDKSYSFVYVKPGKHLIWLYIDGRVNAYELEFVPGQVYYIKTGYELSFLTETEGQALINRMKRYRAAETAPRQKADRIGKTKYSIALAKESAKNKAAIPQITNTSSAKAQPNQIRISRYTPIKLKFLEPVSSAVNHPGDPIRLEIAEDVLINNQLCFRKGTPTQAIISWSKNKGFLWKQGLLDIIIPAVPASDNTAVPTVGQLLLTGGSPGFGKQFLAMILADTIYDQLNGDSDTNSGFGTWCITGGIGLALLKGGSATIPVGREITVWTREDSWIGAAAQH